MAADLGKAVEAAGLLARDRLLSQAIGRDERDYRELNGRLVEKRAQLNQLAREAETARNTYATISGKATEAIVAEGMKSGFVRVVDRALARPVARGTVVKVSLAAVVAFFAGIMASFALEFFATPLAAAPARDEASVEPKRREFGALGK